MSDKKISFEKDEGFVEEIRDGVLSKKEKKHHFSPGPLFLSFLLGAAALMIVLLVIGNLKLPFPPDDPDPSVPPGRVIAESIQEISELSTLEYDYTYIGEFTKSRELDFKFIGLKIPFTEKNFIASFNGTIKYGLDLSKLKEPTINDRKKTITFDMPEVCLLSHELNLESIKYWDENNNLFNPLKPSDGDAFKRKHKKDAEDQAIERGILKRVQEHTTTVITSFVQNIFSEYKDYEIICKYPKQKTIKRIEYED